MTGYKLGVEQSSITVDLDGTFKKSGAIYGVDALVFKSSAGGKYWRMDNFEFEVPEPVSLTVWSMLGVGGIGIAAWKRRRQK